MAGGTVEPTTGSQGPAETMMAPQAQGVLARLAVTAGPQQGRTFQLKEGGDTLGLSSWSQGLDTTMPMRMRNR